MHLHQIAFVQPALSVMALASGEFARFGVTVKTTLARSSIEQYEGLREGRFDVAVTAMDNVFSWNAKGGEFCILAQIERTTGLSLYGQADLVDLASLRGKRLLVDAPDSGFVIAAQCLLADAGVAPGDYTLVRAGGVKERLDALIAQKGEATLLGPPLTDFAARAGLRELAVLTDSYPAFPGQGLVARRATADSLEVPLTAAINALEATIRLLRDNPSARDLLLTAGLSAGAATAALATLAQSVTPSRDGLNLLVEMRKRFDALPASEILYDSLVDPRFLR